MIFVRHENLKVGMRLAKPIYDKKGVLLYERDSKLTPMGIESVKNFGIIGLYILEPAEPVPPMSEEDIEFERFTQATSFMIADELKELHDNSKIKNLPNITASIIKGYGRLDHKINFVQNLRSKEDELAKHSLYCAMLCAMITHKMNLRLSDQNEAVTAAIVHGVGRLDIPKDIRDKKEKTEGDQKIIYECKKRGETLIEAAFLSTPAINRIVSQSTRMINAFESGRELDTKKNVIVAKVLCLARIFDNMTAMNDVNEPSSEISAVRFLMEHEDFFDKEIVSALTESINLLAPGTSVELTNGDKGLVITENPSNVLEPVILSFGDNRIIDLGQKMIYGDLAIKDVMKTMDNRNVIDKEALKKAGINI
ncbi:MAG: phosphohydrolase [Lachnospiraceae bacterium]|nr:phosphohydrolase [Lachnospiraceae bacterium]